MPKGLLEIQDEINVRFLGVPRDLIETAQAEVTFYVPGYNFMPAYKNGGWDGRVRLMGVTGKTYLNLVDEVLPVFEAAGYEFEIEDNRHDWSSVIDNINYIDENYFSEYQWDNGDPIILRDYQVNAVNTAIAEGQGLLELATGSGKAQPLDSLIMTPSGSINMGDAKIGDIISTIDGGVTEITGVFPQGIKSVYEIEFQDGRKVKCCDEHLWYIYDKRIRRHKDKTGLDRFEVMPAKTIKRILDNNIGTALQIPLSATQHDSQDLPIAPYLLGALIGDGGMTQNSYSFTTMDDDIMERVHSYTVGVGDEWVATSQQNSGSATQYRLRNTTLGQKRPHLKNAIIALGLDKSHSYTKFIPPMYLKSSIEDRTVLLQGLMDTDGYVSPKSNTSYCTTSQQLASDVVMLVRSLGGIAHISEKSPYYTNQYGVHKKGRLAYNVNIQMPDPSAIVYCARKSALARKTQYSDGLALRIVNIIEIGEEPVQCISVEDKSRIYITDQYVVTHNTLICAALSKVYMEYGNVVIMVPNIDLVFQTAALFKRVGIDAGMWYGELKEHKRVVISTWQSLDHFPELFAGVVCCINDEAHQSKAKSVSELLMGPGSHVPFRFGCTGTVPKEDIWQYQIRGVIGPIIFKLRAWELQKIGVLASAEVYQIVLEDSKNPAYKHAQPFEDWSDQLEWMFSNSDRVATVAAILEDTADTEGNVLTLIPYKKHGKALHELIAGSVSVDGDIKGPKRQALYKEFGAGDNGSMIATFGVASTGIDIPRIYGMGFVEPGKKFEKIIQSVGRALRKADDKSHAIILDICGDSDYSKKHAAERRKLYKEARLPCHVETIDYANS